VLPYLRRSFAAHLVQSFRQCCQTIRTNIVLGVVMDKVSRSTLSDPSAPHSNIVNNRIVVRAEAFVAIH